MTHHCLGSRAGFIKFLFRITSCPSGWSGRVWTLAPLARPAAPVPWWWWGVEYSVGQGAGLIWPGGVLIFCRERLVTALVELSLVVGWILGNQQW